LWAASWDDHAKSFAHIIFTGRLAKHSNNFFHIALECSDAPPFFVAHTKPAASASATELVHRLKEDLLKRLGIILGKANAGQGGRLSARELGDLITALDKHSLTWY